MALFAILLLGPLGVPQVNAAEPVTASHGKSTGAAKIMPVKVHAATNITYAEEPDVTPLVGPRGTRVELLPPPGAGPSTNGNQQRFNPQIKPLGAVTTLVSPPQELDRQGNSLPFPEDHASQYFAETIPSARFPERHEAWRGDAEYSLNFDFCYRPLYFEEPNAERYGYSYRLFQPAISAAHFYSTIPLLPVKGIFERPCWCALHPGRDLPGYPPIRSRPRWRIFEEIRSAASTPTFDAEGTSEVPVEPLAE